MGERATKRDVQVTLGKTVDQAVADLKEFINRLGREADAPSKLAERYTADQDQKLNEIVDKCNKLFALMDKRRAGIPLENL